MAGGGSLVQGWRGRSRCREPTAERTTRKSLRNIGSSSLRRHTLKVRCVSGQEKTAQWQTEKAKCVGVTAASTDTFAITQEKPEIDGLMGRILLSLFWKHPCCSLFGLAERVEGRSNECLEVFS